MDSDITAVNKNATGETLQRKPWTKNNRIKENGTTHNCVIIHEFFVCYEVTLNYAYKNQAHLQQKKIKKIIIACSLKVSCLTEMILVVLYLMFLLHVTMPEI